jgi:hypothetical protein
VVKLVVVTRTRVEAVIPEWATPAEDVRATLMVNRALVGTRVTQGKALAKAGEIMAVETTSRVRYVRLRREKGQGLAGETPNYPMLIRTMPVIPLAFRVRVKDPAMIMASGTTDEVSAEVAVRAKAEVLIKAKGKVKPNFPEWAKSAVVYSSTNILNRPEALLLNPSHPWLGFKALNAHFQ